MSNLIEFKFDDIEQMKKIFDPKIIDKAVNTANVKTARKTRTLISKEARKIYNVKAGDIGKVVGLRRTPDGMLIIYQGARISLGKFTAKSKKVQSAKGKRTGVTVRVRKDNGRKIVKKGFMVKDKIFARKGVNRFPIKLLTGPAIAQMVGTQFMQNQVQQFAEKESDIQLTSSMNFWLKKAAGKL